MEHLTIVYNRDARLSKNGKRSAYPMLITYNPRDETFSSPVRLGIKSSTDHHYSPIIWADEDEAVAFLLHEAGR